MHLEEIQADIEKLEAINEQISYLQDLDKIQNSELNRSSIHYLKKDYYKIEKKYWHIVGQGLIYYDPPNNSSSLEDFLKVAVAIQNDLCFDEVLI